MTAIALPLLLLLPAAPGHAWGDPGPATVSSLDLPRYMGTWYEISAVPSLPQRGCADTVVYYRLAPEGGFELLNTCWKGETYKPYHGMAKPVEAGSPAKFYAKFVLFLGSDYWIVDLDPKYRWAAVGVKNRRQLWVISRDPTLDEAVYKGILERASAKGFDVSKLVRTPRTGRKPPADPWPPQKAQASSAPPPRT